MLQQYPFVATLALSPSKLACVVLLTNRLFLGLPYLLSYHTLLPLAAISKTDVRSLQQLLHAKEKIKKTFHIGQIDGLINCAGIDYSQPLWN